MDIVLITGGGRPEYFTQTLSSLFDNAAHPEKHNLVVVHDYLKPVDGKLILKRDPDYGNAVPDGTPF